MALLGNLTVGILGNMSGLSSTFKGAQSEVQKFGNNMQRIGKDISSVGDTLTRRITMPAVAAVSALTGITLVKGFDRLVGIDTAQAKLKALGHDAKSVEIIMSSALDSVRGTAFGLDEAATTAANAVAAGIPPGKELTRYLSLTSDTAAVAGASLADMGGILNKVTTSGKAYNSELQMLSDRGLPIYQWLAEEANTTADAIFDMASKGEVSTEMLLNAIEKNIGGAAKTMGEESFTAAIANIGADIARIGAAFLDAGGEGEGFFSTVKPLLTEFREMLASVEERAAEWGAKFGEVFNNFIDRIRELKAWFDDLSPSMQSAILKAIGIGSAILVGIGPALKIVGGLISGIGSLISFFGMLATPVGIAVASVAALIAIGVALWQNWDTIKEKMQPIFEAFAPMIETLKESFQTLMESLAPVGESLKQLFESLMPILQTLGMIIGGVVVTALGILISLFNGVVAAIGPIVNAFINLLDVVVNVVNAILSLLQGDFSAAMAFWEQATQSSIEFVKNLWDGVVNFFSTFVQSIIDFFTNLYNVLVGNSIIPDMVIAIIDWFKNLWDTVVDFVKGLVDGVIQFFKNLWDNTVSIFNSIKDFFTTVWDGIKSTFNTVVGFIVDFVKTQWENLKSNATSVFNAVKSFIETVWNGIKSFFSTVISTIVDFVKTRWDNLKTNTTNSFNAVRDLITNIWNNIKSFFTETLGNIWTTIKNKFQGIVNSVRERMSNVKTTIQNIWNEAKNFLANINLYDIGRDIIQGLINGIGSMAQAVWDKAKSIARGIGDSIKNALSISSPSKLMIQFGKWVGEGLAIGIEDMIAMVKAVAQGLGLAAIPEIPDIPSPDFDLPDGPFDFGEGGSGVSRPLSVLGGITQQITIISPDATSPSENARKMKQASQQLAMEWGVR